ncbi:hypothetical protein [Seonamhaeicola sp. ML3]|uniref:hypothetical protein n=1 Tax=Seonamhaeicola sp. ML3 TaxID=2937786 RepID=UPI00200CD074|nr:hypothetical protein [Seonamhaeicola sp. ML3]
MKTVTIHLSTVILCLTLLLCFKVNSQEEAKKVRIYKIWVELTDKTKQKGFLYAIDDKSLKIISDLPLKNESEILNINPEDINQIKIQRKGKMVRSILIGGLSGGLLATLGSSDTSDDDSVVVQIYSEAAKAGSIVFGTLVGTSLGAIIGTGKKKIDISGDAAIFKSKREELSRYAMVKKSR